MTKEQAEKIKWGVRKAMAAIEDVAYVDGANPTTDDEKELDRIYEELKALDARLSRLTPRGIIDFLPH